MGTNTAAKNRYKLSDSACNISIKIIFILLSIKYRNVIEIKNPCQCKLTGVFPQFCLSDFSLSWIDDEWMMLECCHRTGKINTENHQNICQLNITGNISRVHHGR